MPLLMRRSGALERLSDGNYRKLDSRPITLSRVAPAPGLSSLGEEDKPGQSALDEAHARSVMSGLVIHGHPFSSYCQKVLIALHENGTPFTFRMLSFDDPESCKEFARLWPIEHMPILVDDGRVIAESSIIIEHLQLRHPGPVPLIPEDTEGALEARFMDRVFDNHVMTPMQRIVFDFIRPPEERDPMGVENARGRLDKSYTWLDAQLDGRAWAAGDTFTLADCAAAPSLFYADWVHPIPESLQRLRDYRARLLKRPSFARCVEEGRPYRHLFPPGAPDRD
jgi:glutathione S-transferase